ncbi:MAG: hypothetical protein WBX38_10915 [Candidatus Sulfotelmatobacter sp.]
MITVSPSSENFVPVSGTFQFTATVTGSSNTGVTWGLQPNLGCAVSSSNGGLGTISATGLYTAPSTIPISPCAVVVTATANADSTAQFQTLIYVQVAVSITTLPPQNQVATGASFQFGAMVSGSSGNGAQVVQWQVTTPNGGTIIASSGFYTAPSTPISGVTITATSVFDTSARPPSGTATISVVSGPGAGAISISPAGASIPVGGTFQFTATEFGVANPKLHWSLTGGGCGTSNLGAINESGVYTAPPTSAALAASPCHVGIKASSADGRTGSAVAGLHVALAINGSPNDASLNNIAAPTTIGAGANWLYSAAVAGADAPHQGVLWSATTSSPGECTYPAGQFQSSKPPYANPYSGLYIAPLCVPSAPVTITATSEFDPTQSVSTTVNVQKNDPVGTATGSRMACPANIGGTTDATCYQLDVSCPGAADLTAYLKVNQPTGTPLGTVILAGSSGANHSYDADPEFLESDGTTNGGFRVANGLLNSAVANEGFTTVQAAFSPLDNASEFPPGWLAGPGGPRRLACRYATVAQWVYTNIHNSNTSAPMCATGNGGGAAAIAYAVTDYDQSEMYSMIEATGGPAMSRLDLACAPNATRSRYSSEAQLRYSLADAAIIDPAYGDEPLCSNAVNGSGTQAPAGLFLSDSVLGGSQPPDGSATKVNIVLQQAVPLVSSGAQQIVTEIQQHCKLP